MKKTLLAAVAVVTMGALPMTDAFAAPPAFYSQHNDRGHNDDRFQRGYYEVNGHRYDRQRGPSWKAPRDYRHQTWSRGQRLPVDYRRTVVRDYHHYHLAAPPRGYEYVRVDNDVILTSVATGVIAAVIANAFLN